MGVRALELGELCIAYGNFRDTRTALAKETVCCKPWGNGTLLNILAKSDIDGIVIFRYITIDIVQSAVARLHVELATDTNSKKRTKAEIYFLERPARLDSSPKHTTHAAMCQ